MANLSEQTVKDLKLQFTSVQLHTSSKVFSETTDPKEATGIELYSSDQRKIKRFKLPKSKEATLSFIVNKFNN